MGWGWLVGVLSFCFRSTSASSCGVVCRHRSLQPSLLTAWHRGSLAPALVSLCVSLWPKSFWTGVWQSLLPEVCFLLSSSESWTQATHTLGPREALRRCRPSSRLSASRQSSSSEISRGPFQGDAVPAELPSGANCHRGTIPERSKRPSPCASGDSESSLKFAGIVMY